MIEQYGKELWEKRLKQILGKKFDTTMIFALSQMELAFGSAWGIGKADDKLTEDEKMSRMKWVECRNNILNMGNHQKRNAMKELGMHNIQRKFYNTKLYPVNTGE